MNKGYFLQTPSRPYKEPSISELNRVMSESVWENEPPILLSINISKDAPSGDNDITFAFTYGDEQNLKQDFKTVPFHITSKWERNQGWVLSVGVAIAFFSLLIIAFIAFLSLLINLFDSIYGIFLNH